MLNLNYLVILYYTQYNRTCKITKIKNGDNTLKVFVKSNLNQNKSYASKVISMIKQFQLIWNNKNCDGKRVIF